MQAHIRPWHCLKGTHRAAAQFELYSSRVRDFEVRGRQSHPRADGADYARGLAAPAWRLLGRFAAANVKGVQARAAPGDAPPPAEAVFAGCALSAAVLQAPLGRRPCINAWRAVAASSVPEAVCRGVPGEHSGNLLVGCLITPVQQPSMDQLKPRRSLAWRTAAAAARRPWCRRADVQRPGAGLGQVSAAALPDALRRRARVHAERAVCIRQERGGGPGGARRKARGCPNPVRPPAPGCVQDAGVPRRGARGARCRLQGPDRPARGLGLRVAK